MSALPLIEAVQRAGGAIILRGDRLRLSAPQPLPENLLQELRTHKAEVIDYLQHARGKVEAAFAWCPEQTDRRLITGTKGPAGGGQRRRPPRSRRQLQAAKSKSTQLRRLLLGLRVAPAAVPWQSRASPIRTSSARRSQQIS